MIIMTTNLEKSEGMLKVFYVVFYAEECDKSTASVFTAKCKFHLHY